MTYECPVCGEEQSSLWMPFGILVCERGHLVTIAPVEHVDLAVIEEIQDVMAWRHREEPR
jgi:hypothetical protein